MSTDQTLARIDATLEDYDQWDGHSPDAARWTGGPTEGEWPTYVMPRDLFTFDLDSGSFAEAMRLIAEATIQLGDQLEYIKRQAEAEYGKSWAYLVQRSERPLAAAERTSSLRRRAGSRRVKRQARRRG